MMTGSDTIAAIATAMGTAGVSIIRISGPAARSILELVFHRPQLKHVAAGRIHYGHVVDPRTGVVVDEAMAWFYLGPSTYTRESMAEIQCHGGAAMPNTVLALVLAAGARIAEPGEFSLRAFLNGRIDLVQAEALLDIVTAKTEAAASIARLGGDGRLSHEIRDIRGEIINLLAHVTATIDFPDDNVPDAEASETLTVQLIGTVSRIQCLVDSYQSGRRFREGARVAIVGRTNVGKSSLLNALARHDRAIVSDVAGTTRDTIDELIEVEGIPVVLTDTAGLRESSNPIELLGIARTQRSAETSDAILLVIDASRELAAEDHRVFAELPRLPIVTVLNKSDLPARMNETEVKDAWQRVSRTAPVIVRVSAETLDGMALLTDVLARVLEVEPNRVHNALLITNHRHFASLQQALHDLRSLYDVSNMYLPADVKASTLLAAATALGAITGESATDEVIATIFSRFCIGK